MHLVPPWLLGRNAQDLGVLAGFVAHEQHPDRPRRDPHTGVDGILQQHQGVEWITVTAEGLGDVPVVRRVRRRREQPPVEEDPAGLVVDLVLVAAAARDLDHDVDAVIGQRAHGHAPCSHIRPQSSDRSQ